MNSPPERHCNKEHKLYTEWYIISEVTGYLTSLFILDGATPTPERDSRRMPASPMSTDTDTIDTIIPARAQTSASAPEETELVIS